VIYFSIVLFSAGTKTYSFVDGDCTESEAAYLLAISEKVHAVDDFSHHYHTDFNYNYNTVLFALYSVLISCPNSHPTKNESAFKMFCTKKISTLRVFF